MKSWAAGELGSAYDYTIVVRGRGRAEARSAAAVELCCGVRDVRLRRAREFEGKELTPAVYLANGWSWGCAWCGEMEDLSEGMLVFEGQPMCSSCQVS